MVSSSKNDVDDYILNLNHPQKEEVVKLRKIILNSNSQITEHIKWNAPSFCINNDDRVTMNLQPGRILRLIFHRGAKVKDSKNFQFKDDSKLMKWLSKDRAQIEIHNIEELDLVETVLSKLVDRWVRETS